MVPMLSVLPLSLPTPASICYENIMIFKMKVNMLATLILSPILLGSIAQASDPTFEVTLTRTFNILPDRKIAIQPPDVAPSSMLGGNRLPRIERVK